LRQYGWRERYVSEVPGRNSRLDELQAAVLRVLLPHLETSNAHRRAVAARYDAGLASAPVVTPAPAAPGAVHVYHQYVVRTPERDRLRTHLAERGIGTAVLYPVPVHRQPAYRHLDVGEGLPVTDRVCGEILSLPMGAHVSPEAAEAVIEAVLAFDAAEAL
ncbi:MAG TPA: DegT/DnrJ/EryC1/StrS family aminotransferase, partial [Acidimicrobiales bacterium]